MERLVPLRSQERLRVLLRADHRRAAVRLPEQQRLDLLDHRARLLRRRPDRLRTVRPKQSGATGRRSTTRLQGADWAQDAVYYYIFPERFRNGDTANDPRPGNATYLDGPVERHSNWLDKPYVPGDADGSTTDDGVYNNDFFGGDLAGIIEKLDYLKKLGVNTLYINPIFEAGSNHKYDTADYLKSTTALAPTRT